MRIYDPQFSRPSAIELDGITSLPRCEGPEVYCSLPPLAIAGIIAGGAALAGAAGGAIANKQYKPSSYDIKEESFDNPYFKSSRSAAIMERDLARNREAPQATSAQQGGIREYRGANLGPSERAGVAQLGPAAQGTAERAGQTQISREDAEFRQGQAQLAAQLQAQAAGQGPSLATQQLKQATDRNIAQQAAAAAAAGGNSALAQRNLSQNAAQLGRSAAADAAQMRIQEQLAAREQLAGVLAGARGQDIGLAQAQAQLQQQINLANQQAGNQFGLANMEALNQFALEQARLQQQGRQFDVGAANEFALQRAQMQQQAGLASQAQYNEMLARNTQNEQQVRLANMEATLRQRGMNDEQIRAMMGMQLAQEEAQRQAMIDKERLEVQQNAAMQGIALQGHEGSQQRTQAIIGGLFGGLGAAGAAFSDPKAKDDMRSMGPKSSLKKYMNRKFAGSQSSEIEARQMGGPVAAGRQYLVGEAGPEIVVPSSGPAARMGPMGGMDVQATNRMMSDFATQYTRDPTRFVPMRADGGPVNAGQPYVVGERGPEIIVPNASGTVVPNEAISTWGTGTKSPEAFWAGERAAQLDKQGLDAAMKRSITKDNLREANNQAIALETRQRFEAEAKADAKKKEDEFRKQIAPIQQGAKQFGASMSQGSGMIPRVETPSFSAGPRTTLAQYLSQFGGKF